MLVRFFSDISYVQLPVSFQREEICVLVFIGKLIFSNAARLLKGKKRTIVFIWSRDSDHCNVDTYNRLIQPIGCNAFYFQTPRAKRIKELFCVCRSANRVMEVMLIEPGLDLIHCPARMSPNISHFNNYFLD